jgi:hypothetical protein
MCRVSYAAAEVCATAAERGDVINLFQLPRQQMSPLARLHVWHAVSAAQIRSSLNDTSI